MGWSDFATMTVSASAHRNPYRRASFVASGFEQEGWRQRARAAAMHMLLTASSSVTRSVGSCTAVCGAVDEWHAVTLTVALLDHRMWGAVPSRYHFAAVLCSFFIGYRLGLPALAANLKSVFLT